MVPAAAGPLLIGTGLWRLLSRGHLRWVGMRLSPYELMTWSFLMSPVHGAGLMLVPVLAHHAATPVPASLGWAAAASLLHAAAMLATAGAVLPSRMRTGSTRGLCTPGESRRPRPR